MRKMVGYGAARGTRISALVLLAALVTGCSAEVTRLSQPFFSEDEPEDLTGSRAPLGQRQVAAVPTASSAPRTAITSAPYEAPRSGSSISASPVEPANIPRAAGGGFAVVRAEHGDSAYSLSRRYGVPARSIIAANNLRNANDLLPGQEVRIPPVGWQAPETRSFADAADRTGAERAPGTEGGRTHVVASGETLYAISRRYDVKMADLARANGLQSLDRIRSGQTLTIPGGEPVRVASAAQFATDAAPARTPVPAARPQLALREAEPAASGAPEPRRVKTEPIRVATVKPAQPVEIERQPASEPNPASFTPETGAAPGGTQALPEPAAMSAGKFRWPVRGRIISGFGAKPNGVQNDGINVAVPEGTSVKAAENGVVAYVGNELKGYGNLILIRHADDWVTAYAHNSQILVKRGDQVQRGQIIAKAGQTGAVSQPQLHFELRKGSRPVDPVTYMSES